MKEPCFFREEESKEMSHLLSNRKPSDGKQEGEMEKPLREYGKDCGELQRKKKTQLRIVNEVKRMNNEITFLLEMLRKYYKSF